MRELDCSWMYCGSDSSVIGVNMKKILGAEGARTFSRRSDLSNATASGPFKCGIFKIAFSERLDS